MQRARFAVVFLPSKENDFHCFCGACLGKSCKLDDRCEECHNWSYDHCNRVSEYLHKLSLQREKKHERKAKASSSFSSLSGFLPSMLVPLYQLLSSADIVTTTPSSLVCAVRERNFEGSSPSQSCRWEAYLVGIGVYGSPLVPTSGL